MPHDHAITSNEQFMTKLKNYEQLDGDQLVSFDVVSLFTNVPLLETIEIITNRLYSGTSKSPLMPKSSFQALMKCATSGIFTHRNQLFQQCDGVSMGNPLAPTLANFFMGHLEEQLLKETTNEFYPILYMRYVDDIFCIFRRGIDFQPFQRKLNQLHQNLKFTAEYGGNNIPFLDTHVHLLKGRMKTTVYRKKTNTNVIINRDAVAPTVWKRNLISCFLHRAEAV